MIRCPACSELNPNDHQFCGYCGNRLSTPTRDEPTLPTWLADDANATQPVPSEQVPAQAADADDTLPPWLRGAEQVSPNETQPVERRAAERAVPLAEHDGGSDSNETVPELPFWLSKESSPTTAHTERTPAAAPAQHTGDQPAPSAEEAANDDALPAWLRDNVAASATTPPTHEHADRAASAQPTEPEPPVLTTTASDDALPPWLFAETATTGNNDTTPVLAHASPRALDQEPPAPSTPASSSAPAPAHDESLAWLMGEQAAPAPAAAPSTNAADQLPDWLRDDISTPAPAEPASTTTQELPAWLRDDPFVSTLRDAPAPEQPSVPVVEQRSSPASANDSLPAWLRDDASMLQEPSAAFEGEPAPTREHENVPASDGAAESQATSTAANETLPAWLHEQASPATGDSSATQPLEVPSSEDTEAAPVGSVRVYDTPVNEAAPLTGEDAPVSEPQPPAGAAVYDAPADTLPSEAHIAALLATPTATPTDTPAETPQAAAPTPQAQPTEAPAIPPVAPASAPPHPTPVMPPPPAQRSNTRWIVLAVVLLLAVLAVGWLALRANGFI